MRAQPLSRRAHIGKVLKVFFPPLGIWCDGESLHCEVTITWPLIENLEFFLRGACKLPQTSMPRFGTHNGWYSVAIVLKLTLHQKNSFAFYMFSGLNCINIVRISVYVMLLIFLVLVLIKISYLSRKILPSPQFFFQKILVPPQEAIGGVQVKNSMLAFYGMSKLIFVQ